MTVTIRRVADESPRFGGRAIGAVYFLFFLTAILGELFLQQAGISGLGVGSGDAAATATSILAHEASFQLGVALGIISIALYVVLTGLLYQLFRAVSRSISLLAVFFSLVGLATQAFGTVFLLAPLVLLDSSPYLNVFRMEQLQALALIFVNLNHQVGHVALVFDGLFLLLLGYLVFQSTFLPRILGALIALAGLGWLTYLSPPLASYLVTYTQVLGFVAEALLMLWLLTIGVNVQHWKKQASAEQEK